jgi:ribosome-associated toxin RatA of RatAB toxin-antitoxin module
MSTEHSVPEIDAATLGRLDRGEIIIRNEARPGSSTPVIFLQAAIDAPASKVWNLIDQSARYQEFMPRVKKSEELSRQGMEVRTRMTIDMPFPLKNLTATTRALHTVVPDTLYKREWKMESGDYETNEGAWVLIPFPGQPGRTIATYRATVQPKIPLPGALKTMAQEKALPGLVESLRTRVRTHG